MNKFKRTLSGLCSIVMATSILSLNAFAADMKNCEISADQVFPEEPMLSHEELVEKISADPNTITINEYDLIMQQKQGAAEVLENDSATSEAKAAAASMMELDPVEEIYTLQSQTDSELKSRGINEERIEKIRDFDGSVSATRAVMANLSIDATNKCTKNASGYWAKVAMSFYWDDLPIVQKRDAMVASASTDFMAVRVADVKAHVNYVSSVYPSDKKTTYFTNSDLTINPFSDGKIAGFGFEFDDGLYRSMSGTAVFVFKSLTNNYVSLSYGYAHASAQITASLGIDFTSSGMSGGLGFGLSNKYTVVAAAEDPIIIS